MNSQTIEQNWKNLRDNPNTKVAAARLDVQRFYSDESICESASAAEYNHRSFTKSLQDLKRRMSSLPPDVEALYLQRAEQRVDAHNKAVAAAERISEQFTSSGCNQILLSNATTVFSIIQPNEAAIVQHYKGLGASDDDIAHSQTWLRANNWNPLSYPGAGGTFAGLVNVGKSETQALNNELAAIRNHGLPIIVGANNTGDWVLLGSLTVLTACFIFVPGCVAAAINAWLTP